jgi:antitoxin VapB
MAETRRCAFLASLSFPEKDAIIRKEGERLIIEPAPPQSLLALLATLAPVDEESPPIPDPAPDPVEL